MIFFCLKVAVNQCKIKLSWNEVQNSNVLVTFCKADVAGKKNMSKNNKPPCIQEICVFLFWFDTFF